MISILLVQSNADDSYLVKRLLVRTHPAVNVTIVQDGCRVPEVLASGPLPDMVIIDLRLPKISGLDVLRHLRNERRTRDIPALMLSDALDAREAIECMRAGATRYVRKPIEPSEFNTLLLDAFDECLACQFAA